jgi:transposase
MLKAQLYNLIKLNKPKHKCYVIYQILADKGHIVLQLPPYHPELNPTEHIWADVKLWVASKNTTFEIKNVQQIFHQKKKLGKKSKRIYVSM